jgi:arylsulfatase A-like enzyme
MKKTHFGPNGERQFNWYSERTADAFPLFLKEVGDRSFFLWVGFTDPHRPYGETPKRHNPSQVIVPPQLVDSPETRQDLAQYYDAIARMDDEVGRFVSELERRQLRRKTLIVFISDNGMPFPRAKGTVYDAGVRTPLIVSWPGVVPQGVRRRELVSVIDLAPTFLDLAGLPVPSEMQGSSIRAFLLDPTLPGRRFVYSERNWHNCDEHIRSVRSERYRLILNAYAHLPFGSPADVSSSPSWYALIERRRTGALSPEQARLFEVPRPRVELYDLERDPGEFVNLADRPDHRDIALELLAVLNRWMEATGDFPSTERRRPDNTDRITGVKFGPRLPAMLDKR